MTTPEREKLGEFIRLDHADPELSRVELLEVFAVAAEADADLAHELLRDPLTVLKRSEVDDIGDDWEVTVERVNAQVALPVPAARRKRPNIHHIVGVWIVIRANRHAHCVYYRMPGRGRRARAPGQAPARNRGPRLDSPEVASPDARQVYRSMRPRRTASRSASRSEYSIQGGSS